MKIIVEIFGILFSKPWKSNVYFTVTLCFMLAVPFQVAHSHMWLMVMVLNAWP